jgi:hypothetical protein
MFGSKLVGTFLCAGTYGCQFETLVLFATGYHPVCYVVGANNTETDFLH